MKKIVLFLTIVIMTTGLFFGCGVKPHTEVISAVIDSSVEIGWDASEGMGVALSPRIARVKFDIYNCKDIQEASEKDELKEWLSNYAFCYNDGKKLELDSYITFEDKKESKHTFIVDYLISVADEEEIKNMSFSFTLEGFETTYDGEFIVESN